eukprot:s735_g19.t1
MSLRWLLYQCPCNPGVSVIQNVSQVADFLLRQIFGNVTNVTIHSLWFWGAVNGNGKECLHVAEGVASVGEWRGIRSLVVVSRDTATQPYGIVVVGADGRLACIDRTLWVATATETQGVVCGPAIESRGQSLENAWVHAKAAASVWTLLPSA